MPGAPIADTSARAGQPPEPASCSYRDAPPGRELGELGGRERQVCLPQPGNVTGDLESGKRDRRRATPGEHEVPVLGKGRHQARDHARSRRVRCDQVHVVHDDGHLGGRLVPDGLGQRLDGRHRRGLWLDAHRPAEPVGERGRRHRRRTCSRTRRRPSRSPRRCRRSPGRGRSSCRSRREPRPSRSAARTVRVTAPPGVRAPTRVRRGVGGTKRKPPSMGCMPAERRPGRSAGERNSARFLRRCRPILAGDGGVTAERGDRG